MGEGGSGKKKRQGLTAAFGVAALAGRCQSAAGAMGAILGQPLGGLSRLPPGWVYKSFADTEIILTSNSTVLPARGWLKSTRTDSSL